MKLLFDQNISFRIVKKIAHQFPYSEQVRTINLENCTDLEIWEFAKKNHFSIISFDAYFFNLSSLRGVPLKIIWLRFGKMATNSIAEILLSKANIIQQFLEAPGLNEVACLEIDE